MKEFIDNRRMARDLLREVVSAKAFRIHGWLHVSVAGRCARMLCADAHKITLMGDEEVLGDSTKWRYGERADWFAGMAGGGCAEVVLAFYREGRHADVAWSSNGVSLCSTTRLASPLCPPAARQPQPRRR